MTKEPIIGKKIRLVPFSEKYITADYLSWLNSATLMRFSRQKHFTHTKASCQTYLETFTGTPNYFWAIENIKSGIHLGTMTAYVDPHHHTTDLGLLIGQPDAQGKGFGLDAWQIGMDFMFQKNNCRKVTGGTNAQNIGMVKIMEKCGMKLEGCRQEQELIDGQPTDVVYYGKINQHWFPTTSIE